MFHYNILYFIKRDSCLNNKCIENSTFIEYFPFILVIRFLRHFFRLCNSNIGHICLIKLKTFQLVNFNKLNYQFSN